MNENTQKIKLKLMEMLKENSSPEHPLTTEIICKNLAAFDISCDRRSVMGRGIIRMKWTTPRHS